MILKPKIKKPKIKEQKPNLKRVSSNPRRLDPSNRRLTEMIRLAEKCYLGEQIDLIGSIPNQIFVEVKWYMCYLYSMEFNNTPLDNLAVVSRILPDEVGDEFSYFTDAIMCKRVKGDLVICLVDTKDGAEIQVHYDPMTEKITVEE